MSEIEKFSWDQDVADATEEALMSGDLTVPDMKDMIDVAAKAEAAAEQAEEEEKKGKNNEDDEEDPIKLMESLALHQEVTPKAQSRPFKSETPPSKYQESFTSQREAAELREDIEQLGNRMSTIEQTLELVLKERKELPSHLASLKMSLNEQLTLMLDKLHVAIEAGIGQSTAVEAEGIIQTITEESVDKLTAAGSFLAADPSPSSPLVRTGASLTGRRKFKPKK